MSEQSNLLVGDCIEVLRTLPESSIDAVVTDPPYGIGFMGHEWDQPGVDGKRPAGHVSRTAGSLATVGKSRAVQAGCYDLAPAALRAFQEWTSRWATEVLRVLKPGGHLISFASTRTNHRHVCGLEDAGFEIRDSLCWLFGEGFPKSRNLQGDWAGWGSALKPGHEPITLARAPMATRAMRDNVAAHGVAALNIDACRIPVFDEDYARNHSGDRGHGGTRARVATDFSTGGGSAVAGARWPANVVLDDLAAELLDEQSGVLVSGANPTRRNSDKFRDVYGDFTGQEECAAARGTDVGGASRFFYCAKASRAERDAGLDRLPPEVLRKVSHDLGSLHPRDPAIVRNWHPTVKPIELMRWLIRLVTPAGGLVLDPFVGSGTTGCAAAVEDRPFIGIDREPAYVALATERIRHWSPQGFQLDLLGEGAAA